MFTIFQEEKVISALMGLFLVLSILTRLALGMLYQRMIKETDNMAATENKLLKQCKLKFANCFQLNNGVANIPVFVDKFLNRLTIGHLSFDGIYHLSGQLMLLSVVCSGVGVSKSIIQGRMLGEILPYYIASFLGLYVYFSVSAIVDVKGKRRVLKVNLVDYLENHLSARIDVTDQDIQMLYGEDWMAKNREKMAQEQTGQHTGLHREKSAKTSGRAPREGVLSSRQRIGKEREEGLRSRERTSQEREGVLRSREQIDQERERIGLAAVSGRQSRGVEDTGFTKEQEKELEELLLEFLMS